MGGAASRRCRWRGRSDVRCVLERPGADVDGPDDSYRAAGCSSATPTWPRTDCSAAPGGRNDATGGRSGRVVLVTAAGDAAESPSRRSAPTGGLFAGRDRDRDRRRLGAGRGSPPLVSAGRESQRQRHADDRGGWFGPYPRPAIRDAPAHIGVRFALTATGQTSGRIAQATFTDATGLNSVTMLGTQTPRRSRRAEPSPMERSPATPCRCASTATGAARWR